MENNDFILSLIMGGFLLGVIIPLATWVRNANKEKKRLEASKNSEMPSQFTVLEHK